MEKNNIASLSCDEFLILGQEDIEQAIRIHFRYI